MYMRLAFAVAAHMETEILLVDEVLAVGDAAFQKKCLGKMGDVSKKGRTVLFVSHNLHAVIKLCSRALLIDHGNITVDGPVIEVTDKYLESYLVQTQEGEVLLRAWNENRISPGKARVAYLKTLNKNENICSVFEINELIIFEAMLENLSTLGFVLSFSIQNKRDVLVYHIRSQDSPLRTEEVETSSTVRMTIPQLKIVEGTYTVNVWLGNHLDQLEDRVGNALAFHVINRGHSVAPLKSIIYETGEWVLCNREDK
jgi:lipopolysaccharide transport system ATP-binding protein